MMLMMIMLDSGECVAYIGWFARFKDRRQRGTVLHSSNETGELSHPMMESRDRYFHVSILSQSRLMHVLS